MMELELSLLSSLKGEFRPEDYVQPHYKESYRLAIDALVTEGCEKYKEFLKEERVGEFLSEDELLFIRENTEHPAGAGSPEEKDGSPESGESSTGTYWPVHSDLETPDLDLGWPEAMHEKMQTNIDLLFHPPRQNSPSIKEVVRKHIQDARQVIAIVMDIFTDVDIFKETVDASVRGVPVYVLLDDFQFKSFLAMAEKQEIQIQRLRNMKVRTVKGQGYLCRSGAKFHGAMEQKFLLVDCQTVVYGSYSFTWSYEKINLSMVQVITGQLVESYDEEFRMLFARSTVPAVLSPAESVPLEGRRDGSRLVAEHVAPSFQRKAQLRHTLDAVYLKACGRQAPIKNPAEYFDHEVGDNGKFNYRLVNEHLGAPNRFHQLQTADSNSFLKRHSYAGERKESSYVTRHLNYGASNWNVSRDGGQHGAPGRLDYLSRGVADPLQTMRLNQHYNRGENIRQSFHGNDKQVLSIQQNMPSLERTSKSFLRTWRIESYLNNADGPVGDSCEYLDHYEGMENKPSSYMHSRLRSSLVFKSTIPEQPESNSYNSSASTLQGDQSSVHANAQFHSSAQWNPAVTMGNRMQSDEFILKRRSLQILDDPRNNMYNGNHQSAYASLNRAKGGPSVKNSEVFHEDRYKRYSLADPKGTIGYVPNKEASSLMYGTLGRRQAERSISKDNKGTGRCSPNLKEDHRSVSHYDVKKVMETKSPSSSNWQEPPSRTVSATTLGVSSEEPMVKSSNLGSPRFFEKSSKKIKSFLNIPDKSKSRSNQMESSTDMKSFKDEVQKSEKDITVYSTTASSIKSTDSHFRANGQLVVNNTGTPSAPRFNAEERQGDSHSSGVSREPRTPHSASSTSDRLSHAGETRQRNQQMESRLYSRFEPFCVLENKRPLDKPTTDRANLHSLERHNSLASGTARVGSSSEHHTNTRNQQPGHNDNKLGRFIQRVGHFIHKSK